MPGRAVADLKASDSRNENDLPPGASNRPWRRPGRGSSPIRARGAAMAAVLTPAALWRNPAQESPAQKPTG